jgi:hypothetical protein
MCSPNDRILSLLLISKFFSRVHYTSVADVYSMNIQQSCLVPTGNVASNVKIDNDSSKVREDLRPTPEESAKTKDKHSVLLILHSCKHAHVSCQQQTERTEIRSRMKAPPSIG